MCWSQLGEIFDLHGGGTDLIFPHHENEIAQSEGAFGPGTFARHWLHNGMVNFGGEKMSKSLGNVVSIRKVAETHDLEALRLLLVSVHYRSPVTFTLGPERTVRPPSPISTRPSRAWTTSTDRWSAWTPSWRRRRMSPPICRRRSSPAA
jgi:hypothetical protein